MAKKNLILMYLESFSMNYSPHWDLQLKKTNIYEKKFNTFVQVLNFLDVFIILHQNGWLETDTFYWETNSNDFINYFIHNLEHTKQNIYNLAKTDHRICFWQKKDKWKVIWTENVVTFM